MNHLFNAKALEIFQRPIGRTMVDQDQFCVQLIKICFPHQALDALFGRLQMVVGRDNDGQPERQSLVLPSVQILKMLRKFLLVVALHFVLVWVDHAPKIKAFLQQTQKRE